MDLDRGGHLTHGRRANQSGKWFKAGVLRRAPEDHLIDYDAGGRGRARASKPKLIIAGGSAYSRQHRLRALPRDRRRGRRLSSWSTWRTFAGLVAGGVYPSPLPHAHVVTTTTHKTLRGPRGGMILTNDAEIGKKINSAVFPGLQGGPLMHVIAAKAVAFGEALRPEFKVYAQARGRERQGAGRQR